MKKIIFMILLTFFLVQAVSCSSESSEYESIGGDWRSKRSYISLDYKQGEEKQSFLVDFLKNSVIVYYSDESQSVFYHFQFDEVEDEKFSSNNLKFIDLNFDGYTDFYFPSTKEGDEIKYNCWLAEEKSDEFIYNESLSGIINLKIEDKKLTGIIDGKDSTITWENGEMIIK